MKEFVNSNYVKKPWRSDFVGVEKYGGIGNSRLKNRVSYVVRVPMWGERSTALCKCASREEAERRWREWDGWGEWGGVDQWLDGGEVPFVDHYARRKR